MTIHALTIKKLLPRDNIPRYCRISSSIYDNAGLSNFEISVCREIYNLFVLALFSSGQKIVSYLKNNIVSKSLPKACFSFCLWSSSTNFNIFWQCTYIAYITCQYNIFKEWFQLLLQSILVMVSTFDTIYFRNGFNIWNTLFLGCFQLLIQPILRMVSTFDTIYFRNGFSFRWCCRYRGWYTEAERIVW
jgi:hypothetical protein